MEITFTNPLILPTSQGYAEQAGFFKRATLTCITIISIAVLCLRMFSNSRPSQRSVRPPSQSSFRPIVDGTPLFHTDALYLNLVGPEEGEDPVADANRTLEQFLRSGSASASHRVQSQGDIKSSSECKVPDQGGVNVHDLLAGDSAGFEKISGFPSEGKSGPRS